MQGLDCVQELQVGALILKTKGEGAPQMSTKKRREPKIFSLSRNYRFPGFLLFLSTFGIPFSRSSINMDGQLGLRGNK